MPTSCSCGGRIIDEVRVKEEYDTRPGKRFFSCINYENYLQYLLAGSQGQIKGRDHMQRKEHVYTYPVVREAAVGENPCAFVSLKYHDEAV
uniref:Uncharacterized protein n=1 Tax=Brassica campestris TaxID=3711 RepID=M4F1E7_BRACM